MFIGISSLRIPAMSQVTVAAAAPTPLIVLNFGAGTYEIASVSKTVAQMLTGYNLSDFNSSGMTTTAAGTNRPIATAALLTALTSAFSSPVSIVTELTLTAVNPTPTIPILYMMDNADLDLAVKYFEIDGQPGYSDGDPYDYQASYTVGTFEAGLHKLGYTFGTNLGGGVYKEYVSHNGAMFDDTETASYPISSAIPNPMVRATFGMNEFGATSYLEGDRIKKISIYAALTDAQLNALTA